GRASGSGSPDGDVEGPDVDRCRGGHLFLAGDLDHLGGADARWTWPPGGGDHDRTGRWSACGALALLVAFPARRAANCRAVARFIAARLVACRSCPVAHAAGRCKVGLDRCLADVVADAGSARILRLARRSLPLARPA